MDTTDSLPKKKGIALSVLNLWRKSMLRPQPVHSTARTTDRSSMEFERPVALEPQEARFLKDSEYQPKRIGDSEYITETNYINNVGDKDAQRLNALHVVLKRMQGANILAPIKREKVDSILEVGYGSGIWAIETANELPHTKIFAFDVRTNALPLHLITNNNAIFQRADLTRGLPYMSKSFDYIHQRLIGSAAPYEQWRSIFEDYYRVLRPGGWVEILEVRGVWKNAGPITTKLFALLIEMCKMRGVDITHLDKLDVHLKNAGFTKVTKKIKMYQCMGSWAGQDGIDMYNQSKGILLGAEPLAIEFGLLQPGELAPLLEQWEEECNRFKPRQPFYLYTAKKPS